MLGFSPVSANPLSAISAAARVFAGSVAFTGEAEFTFVPENSVYQGEVSFEGEASFVFAQQVVRPGIVEFESELSFLFDGTAKIKAEVSFEGNSDMFFDVSPRIYAATEEFASKPTDSRPNYPYLGTLEKAIRFDRSILNSDGIGQVTVGWGEMELNNMEKNYDYLAESYALDGRNIILKVGVAEDGYDNFFTIFDLTMKGGHIDQDVFRISLRDHLYKLETPLVTEVYGGAGNLDGDESLKGKRKPLALGENYFVTPQELVMLPAVPLYQFSTGPSEAITAVYDNAIPLTPATVTDYPTSAALLAATDGIQGSGADIEAGEYATCLAESLIRLGGRPVGTVTCDIKGLKVDGIYQDTTVGIIRSIVKKTDPAVRFSDVSLTETDAAQPAVIGYYLETGEDANTADVVADLIRGIGGWAGYRRDGVFEARIFTLPDGPPVARYSDIDIIEFSREKMPDALEPPPWRYRFMWGRNNTVMPNLIVDPGAGLTEERVAFLKESYRLATSSSARALQIKADHPLAQDPEERESFFRDEAPAQAEADRQLNLFSQPNSIYKVTLHGVPFIHDIGDIIEVTYPRFDAQTGKALRIIAISEDTDENDTEILGFG